MASLLRRRFFGGGATRKRRFVGGGVTRNPAQSSAVMSQEPPPLQTRQDTPPKSQTETILAISSWRDFSCFHAGRPAWETWLISGGGELFFFRRKQKKAGLNAAFLAFCLFCGGKQVKPSPVRRLSTLNWRNLGFRAAKLDEFQWRRKGRRSYFFVAGVSKKRHSRHGTYGQFAIIFRSSAPVALHAPPTTDDGPRPVRKAT